jgi:hypothetical protein
MGLLDDGDGRLARKWRGDKGGFVRIFRRSHKELLRHFGLSVWSVRCGIKGKMNKLVPGFVSVWKYSANIYSNNNHCKYSDMNRFSGFWKIFCI